MFLLLENSRFYTKIDLEKEKNNNNAYFYIDCECLHKVIFISSEKYSIFPIFLEND